MRDAPRRLRALAALSAAAVALSACGDDDEPAETVELSAEAWVEHAERFCKEGTAEAIALPLPTKRREIGPDAAARAEIVTTVRDEIVALGRPEEIDAKRLDAYLGELEADIEQLEQLATDGSSGEMLDESAGTAANRLGLSNCAGFANVIARTP